MADVILALHVFICLLALVCLKLQCTGRHQENEAVVAGTLQQQDSEFCYINDFETSIGVIFTPLLPMSHASRDFITQAMNEGRPFVVSGVTRGWKANGKWSHSYFKEIFRDSKLFSSTFSTAESPQFGTSLDQDRHTYYGVFLNDPTLAEMVAMDYSYPDFIPHQWRVRGNEWLHWGFPPCGAKRHMDLMCTSRISVQVAGRKQWRLHPLLDGNTLSNSTLQNWSSVLYPLEVVLEPGHALVWFPGWEHETRIISGPSISVSLHFTSHTHSVYQNTFSTELHERVSQHCQWRQP